MKAEDEPNWMADLARVFDAARVAGKAATTRNATQSFADAPNADTANHAPGRPDAAHDPINALALAIALFELRHPLTAALIRSPRDFRTVSLGEALGMVGPASAV